MFGPVQVLKYRTISLPQKNLKKQVILLRMHAVLRFGFHTEILITLQEVILASEEPKVDMLKISGKTLKSLSLLRQVQLMYSKQIIMETGMLTVKLFSVHYSRELLLFTLGWMISQPIPHGRE